MDFFRDRSQKSLASRLWAKTNSILHLEVNFSRSMKRLLLCSFLGFLFTLSIHAQDGGKNGASGGDPSKDTTLEHQVGLGIHLIPNWRFQRFKYKYGPPIILQASYKHSLENLKIRSGIAGGTSLLLEDSRSLFFNVGVEKDIWKPGKVYRLGIASDFLFGIIQAPEERRVMPLGIPTIWRNWFGGIGLTLVNEFRLSSRSSLSLELGISGTKSRHCTHYIDRDKECQWTSWEFSPRKYYRQAVLSYHHRF